MRDFANAPFSSDSRDQYVNALRMLEARAELLDKEPDKTHLTEADIEAKVRQ
jgi:hypothetical protein